MTELGLDERVALANKMLLLSQHHDVLVRDGAAGLQHYTAVSHLLEDGQLPAWLCEPCPGQDYKAHRYSLYTLLHAKLKGMVQMFEMRVFFRGVFVTVLAYY